MFLPDNYYKMSLADQQKWWAANDPGVSFLTSNQGGASAAAVNPTPNANSVAANPGNTGTSPLSTATQLGQTGMTAFGTYKQAQAYSANKPSQPTPASYKAPPSPASSSAASAAPAPSNGKTLGSPSQNTAINDYQQMDAKYEAPIRADEARIDADNTAFQNTYNQVVASPAGTDISDLLQRENAYKADIAATQTRMGLDQGYITPDVQQKMDALWDQTGLGTAEDGSLTQVGSASTRINGDTISPADIDNSASLKQFQKTSEEAAALKKNLAQDKQNIKTSLYEGIGGVATEAGSGYGLFTSVKNGSVLGAVSSFAGLYAGMKMISSALDNSISKVDSTLTSGSFGSFFNKIPGLGHAYEWIMNHSLMSAAIVAAVIVAIALLTKKENEAEKQFADFNNMTVWSTGSVLTMASAAAFLTLGYNINTPSTSLNGATMTIPVSTLKSALASGLSNADGSAYSGDVPYNTPIVLKGQAPGGGDQVILINQAGIKNGKAIDALQVYNLSNNMTFSKPTTTTAGTAQAVGGYIPFFVNGKVNPQAVTATNSQSGLLAGTGVMSASGQAGAVAVAGAMNKAGVTVNTVGQ